ncbi:uncharacterized protein LOC101455197 isoform X2 [Ceratitis capitata]|nr:uncharacterized protein LOC101455197 isoform X2 [Ceratitis capitata]
MDTSMKTKEENEARVAEEYLSSLSDLTCNSKPLINMLTMLAEENIGCASVIVKVVEQHIVKVPPDIKLPLLYLIDSIVKNVKSTYIHLFSQCIVNIFCDVFEKVNEKVRERMYALRLTWNEVFPAQKLYALDVKVKRIDNNWPITAKQAQPSIHVNPNFLKQNYELKVQAGDVEEILQAKTRELLELKKRKLELELEATKKSLEEQDKQLSKVTNGLMQPDAMNAMPGVRMPGVPPQIMPPGMMPPGIMPPHHMHPRASHPALMSGAGVPPATLFHPNFHQTRPQQPTHVPVGMMNMPQNFPPASGVNKPKVHPVNPALLNTIRHRDPRLARQQQMQESAPSMRGSSKSSSSSSASRSADDAHKADSKSSSSSYRNGSSKSSRGDVGSTASESRHTSSSSTERTRKGSSTRDKDKDRKRSESKSSTSSGGSSSSERHKSSSSSTATGVISSRSSKKSTSTKCDKDAFEIAPLSTTFKRKSSTTSLSGSESSSSSRKKDAKRKTHTSPTSQKHRSRSRSPIETAINSASINISADRDDRLAIPAFSSKNQSKGPSAIRSDSDHEEELKNAALRIEKKNIKIVTDGCLAFAAQTDTDLRQFLNPIAAYAPNLEQSVRSAEAAAAKVENTTTIAFTPTTTTTSAKVSFKIQKMFNKLDKSTAQQQQHHQQTTLALMSTAGASTTTTAGPIVLDHDDDMMPATITSSSSTTTATANAKNATTANNNIMSTKGSRAGAAVDDADGRDDGVRIGASISSSASVGRHNSSDSIEQQLSKAKVATLSSKEFDVEPMDIDKVKVSEKSDEKKRLSSPNEDRDEPLPKKSRSAKFDALFGDEDVDLRTVMPPQILAVQQHLQKKPHRRESKSPEPPPPPFITDEQNAESWNNLKTSKTPKSTSPSKKSSTLDDVRAKLAKATKYSKLNKSEKSNKDLTRVKLSEPQLNDDSQDANDEKIRTIVAQAQELLEANSINQDQYKNLMQKVMSINESSKLKEAKKRESLGAGQTAQTSKQAAVAEETAEEQRAAAAREAVLKKRIPKLRRVSVPTADNNANSSSTSTAAATEQTNSGSNPSTTRSPIYEERSNDNTDVVLPQRAKPQREKRVKPSKWGEKIDSSINPTLANNNLNQPKPWTKGNMMRPHPGVGGFRGGPPPNMPNMNNMHPSSMPWQMQMPPNGGPPFVPAGPMIRSSVPPPPQAPILPIIPLPPSIPKPCNSIDNPQADLVRTITIDGLSKEIRIYDQVAIVFMELDQPREIGFQAGQRSIIIDDQPPIALQFNDDYKTFNISGQPHRLRFGFPSRELYIDDQWYEIYFGGPPVSIPVQNRIHILKAEGPPPQVNIGALRRDLVVGKINMIVDAHIVIPLFLDAKPQTFKLGNQDHTVQFADNLLTVLLDGEPAKVEYGGLPKSYLLGGVSYFIRFGALPQGLKPGLIAVKDMIYVKTEPPAPQPLIPAIAASANATTDVKPAESMKSEIEAKTEISVMAEQAVPLLTTENKTDAAVKAPVTEQLTDETSEPQVVGTAGSGNSAIPIFSATALNKINIDELFQKLVSSGILGGGGAGNVIAPSNKDAGVLPSAAAPEEELPQPIAIQPIDLGKSETIKTRQMALVDTLFSGMQCSSCGVRFPPEQTIKYSQHLDWHFRQNRRERDQSRKAHSRKWYYDLADWVQYEEIEDLEEREKNFFEAQQNDIETVDETSNQKWLNSPTPLSCPALPEDVDRACDMCQEKLEQFYHEETEEWHLRNAIRVNDKIYHPLCYEDYKAALNAKDEKPDKKTEEAPAGGDMEADDDVIIKIEGDDHSDVEGTAAKSTDNAMDDDDDDVIVLPNEEPSVTEIEDDDEYVPESVPPTSEKATIDVDSDDENKKEEMEIVKEAGEEEENDAADADAAGSDVEIQEPHIPFTDLDTYVEKEQPEADETSQMSFMNVKIKEEPKDDDEDEDDGFEDVGTVVIPLDEEISIQSSEETQTQTITSSTSGMSPTAERPPSSQSLVQVDETEFTEGSAAPIELNTSIDGNPGNEEDEHNLSTVGPSPAIPLASLVNKIKINIAKSSITANSNSNNNSNNTGSSTSQTGAAIPTTTNTLATNNSMNSSSSSPTKGSTTTSDAFHAGDDNAENAANVGDTTAAQYSNVSAISVVSTIPVLCGGGTMSARTMTTVAPPQPAVSSSSNLKSIAANDESSVSTISVIGSYSGSSSTPRYFPPSTTSSAASVTAAASRRQTTAPPKPSTPPPPEEETPSYELKPALQSAKLKKMTKVKCGVETSGLCSVM